MHLNKRAKKRKFLFHNHATSLRIYSYGDCYRFGEESAGRLRAEPKFYETYEKALNALQRYSKKHYGEKSL